MSAELIQQLRGDVQTADCDCERCVLFRAAADRIATLEERLEIDPRHSYDGIDSRDATIKMQDQRIDELGAALAGAQEDARLLDFLERSRSYGISHEWQGDDDYLWTVYRVGGSPNDRDHKFVSEATTLRAAIRAALREGDQFAAAGKERP